jgi:hypothetical protein
MQVHTRRRGPKDHRCPRCRWDAHGAGFGTPPPHSCLGFATPGEVATHLRDRELARMNRQPRARSASSTQLRTRSITDQTMRVY